MKQNWIETITGAVVLAVAVFFVAFAIRAIGGSSFGNVYSLNASFASAEGVNVGGDVRMAGVKIGTIKSMTLNPQDYQANVEISVDSDYFIPTDSEIKIASDGLLGASFVEIVPGADEMTMAAGDQFSFSSGSISLLSLFAKFATGSGK